MKDFKEELIKKNVRVVCLKAGPIPLLWQLWRIHKLIKKDRYTLIHSNLIYADVTLALVKCFFNRKMKLVSGKHGYEESYTNKFGFDPSQRVINLYWLSAKWAEKSINRSFVISDGLYHLFTGLGICKPAKLSVIKYGFDFDSDYQYTESYRRGDPQLIIVGRLSEYKGHRFAIAALKILKEKFPGIKLIIVGSGPLEPELKKMTADFGLSAHIEFAGFQLRPRDWMATSDIVLLPSVSEGLGIVVLEAMSCKKPVVAFKVPSPSEIFEHNKDALLATPYSVEEYASHIERLIDDPGLRSELSEKAYQKLQQEFNASRMIRQTTDFYTEVSSS